MRTLAFVSLCLIAACSKKESPPPQPTAGSGSAPAAPPVDAAMAAVADAAVVIPPYTPGADVPEAIKTAVTAEDRSPDDRKLDAGRKPADVMAFFKIAPGDKVGELFAGGGYTTEVLARIVGDKGHVWAQNTKEINEKFAKKPFGERMQKPVMKNVTAVEQPIDDPFPADAKNLDAVVTFVNYHDTVNMKADRAKMNKAVFNALKKGGYYDIVDSSAVAGHGTKDTDALHRIDEDVVKKEVTAAGFKLDAESDLLRNPSDARDWNSSPRAAGERRGTSDRFVLRFVKP